MGIHHTRRQVSNLQSRNPIDRSPMAFSLVMFDCENLSIVSPTLCPATASKRAPPTLPPFNRRLRLTASILTNCARTGRVKDYLTAQACSLALATVPFGTSI